MPAAGRSRIDRTHMPSGMVAHVRSNPTDRDIGTRSRVLVPILTPISTYRYAVPIRVSVLIGHGGYRY